MQYPETVSYTHLIRTTTCDECGETYQWQDSAMEIVPYEVEYLQNFITVEEQEQMEQEQLEHAQKLLEE